MLNPVLQTADKGFLLVGWRRKVFFRHSSLLVRNKSFVEDKVASFASANVNCYIVAPENVADTRLDAGEHGLDASTRV